MAAEHDDDGCDETAVSVMPSALAADSLHDRLAAVDGFDIDVALRNLGGHLSVLQRVLGVFVETYGSGQPDLLERYSPEKRAAQQVACHSICGACAMVGAAALGARAGELERLAALPGDPPQFIDRAWRLHEELMALATRFEAAISPP